MSFDLKVYSQEQVLEIELLDDDTFSAMLDFAGEGLDDGESYVGAIARRSKWAIATDKRAGVRVFRKMLPNLQLVDTAMLLHHWAVQIRPSDSVLQRILMAVQAKGHYRVRKSHPLAAWWTEKERLIQDQ